MKKIRVSKALIISFVWAFVFISLFQKSRYDLRRESDIEFFDGDIASDVGTLSCKDINIYNSRNLGLAHLIDMDGNVLHSWSANKGPWLHIEMSDKGDLFVNVKDEVLMKLDWDSNIIWENSSRFHHDIDIAENGDIYSLTRGRLDVPYQSTTIPILNDYIVILSPDGTIKKSVSVFKLFGDRIPKEVFDEIVEYLEEHPDERNDGFMIGKGKPFDLFHANSLEITTKDIEGVSKRGNVLVSLRALNLIVIIDLEQEEVVWTWGEGFLSKQHHPTVLDNGNILIFDNEGNNGYSRVVEINPLSLEAEWVYQTTPPENFYSRLRGGNQRLPNGNTLITESDKGHVFELTKEGETVWEFWNPAFDEETNERAPIYRMMRLDTQVVRKLPIAQQVCENSSS
ncbi:aryl-sulfate sulfotransferase [Patescibacteria group bacterium]|nr:aryl-sulfate sulfotransferase [Patescibacteria group bacterium]